MLSTRIVSAPAASASSTCVERLAPRPRPAGRADARARARPPPSTPPASRMWLSLIRIASNSPTRWLVAPPARDRVLLERPQRRRRLARVEDRDAPAGRVDEPARARGDAGQPLQEIERRALADEQRARRSVDRRRSPRPAAQRVAVVLVRRRRGQPGSSWRNASTATSRPASTQSALTRNTPRACCAAATVASVVMSPSRTSSSSARRTMSR